MKIVNGVVAGLELEQGFSTSSEITQMDSSITFLNNYKWEMGDVNAAIFKKQLLSNQRDEKGNRIPYKGTVTDVATKICLAEGMTEEEITPEYLFNRFNKDTDIQALSEFTRSYLQNVNGKMMTRRVLSPQERDENGKYVPNIHDRMSAVTNAIHKHRRLKLEEQYTASNIPKDTITEILRKFDGDEKMVRAVKTRVAFEICVIPLDANTFKLKEAFSGLRGVIYTTSTDNYSSIKAKLHKPGEDTNLDFLEIKISHPVVTKNADKNINKMHSGMKVDYGVFADASVKPSVVIEDFQEQYKIFSETSAQSADDLRSKVMDYRPMTPEEALSQCKDYVIENYKYLDEEEKEKYDDIVQRFHTVLTAEEIASISGIEFAPTPNTEKAEGMADAEPEEKAPEEEPAKDDFFEDMDEDAGFDL